MYAHSTSEVCIIQTCTAILYTANQRTYIMTENFSTACVDARVDDFRHFTTWVIGNKEQSHMHRLCTLNRRCVRYCIVYTLIQTLEAKGCSAVTLSFMHRSYHQAWPGKREAVGYKMTTSTRPKEKANANHSQSAWQASSWFGCHGHTAKNGVQKNCHHGILTRQCINNDIVQKHYALWYSTDIDSDTHIHTHVQTHTDTNRYTHARKTQTHRTHTHTCKRKLCRHTLSPVSSSSISTTPGVKHLANFSTNSSGIGLVIVISGIRRYEAVAANNIRGEHIPRKLHEQYHCAYVYSIK